MSKVILLCILAALPLAGCLGTDGGGCGADECLALSTAPADPAHALELGSFTFQDCRGAIGGTYKPSRLAGQDVPPEFRPAGPWPFVAGLGFDAYRCGRIVAGDAVYHDVAMLWSYSDVDPTNSSWQGDGFSYYTHDLLIDNESLVAAFHALGIRAVNAHTEFIITARVGGQIIEDWRFTSGAVSYHLTFAHDEGPAEILPNTRSFLRQQWFGIGPFHRLDIQHRSAQHEFFGLAAVLLKVSGDSGFEQALGREQNIVDAQTIYDLEWELRAHPIPFT